MNDTIDIRIEGQYGSISDLEWLDVPPFAVVTGVNGTGKSQLLEVIARTYGAWHPRFTQDNTALQGDARAVTDGVHFERSEVFHAYDEWVQPVQGAATDEFIKTVIESLYMQLTRDDHSGYQAGIPWLLEQLGITADDARELSKQELYEKLTPGLLYGLMSRVTLASDPRSSHIGWALLFFAYSLFERDALGLGLSQEEIERRYGEPPWVLLNEILETSGLPFRAVFPTGIRPTSLAYDNTFALRLQDVERGMEVPFEGLSSGEKVIMSTVLWRYGAAASPRRPRHGPAAGSAACSCGERTSFTLTNSPVEDRLSDQGRLSDEMRCANSSRERRPRQRPSTRPFPVGRAVRGRAAILRR
jgi:hypothetical protein